MPASEQTWYNQKVMHIVFGVSALVMTIATLWLLAKDHNRQWKGVQLENRKKSAWLIQARHDSLADQFSTKLENYDAELRQAQSEPIDEDDVAAFERLVTTENERLELPASDFSQLEVLKERIRAAATQTAETRNQLEEAGEDADPTVAKRIALGRGVHRGCPR